MVTGGDRNPRQTKGVVEVSQEISKLYTIKEWPHSWPTEGGLRWLVYNRDFNGFHQVVKRVGRRILLDEGEFFKWVAEQGGRRLSPRAVHRDQGAQGSSSSEGAQGECL